VKKVNVIGLYNFGVNFILLKSIRNSFPGFDSSHPVQNVDNIPIDSGVLRRGVLQQVSHPIDNLQLALGMPLGYPAQAPQSQTAFFGRVPAIGQVSPQR
jgi:hypothetical protein